MDQLANMGEWCTTQHKASGLFERSLKSETTIEQAEAQMLNFLKNNVCVNSGLLAGNSVHIDRLFLLK
jgi:oligoribonuclease